MNDIAQRMLSDIHDLSADIEARAAQIEAERRLPADLVHTLRSIGVFRMYVPQSHGGLELNIASAMSIVTALSRIDSSIGWLAGIGATAPLFATRLPRNVYDAMYRHGPDVIIAGAVQPTGTLEQTAQGWRANGRWAFASGCMHADWLFGVGVVSANGKPVSGANGAGGPPLMHGILLPAGAWRIEDTWDVAGLEGTGSHHISLTNAPVPAEHLIDHINGESCVPGPLFQAVTHLLAPMGSAMMVGMAEGALDAIVALANTGRQQFRVATTMRESEIFQFELGRVEAELRAARALHDAQVRTLWQRALEGTLKDDTLYAQATQTAVWVANVCVRVADACFALGGGAAIYDSSPLQRRLRDLHVAAQHAAVHPRHYVTAGKLLLNRG
ncbi:acyl-CoA dehydrogenase family protein [Paraburkholderia humisilvae]|uniref:Flavin-dependent monooxygenase, oxygenase subunit HsaA n=1 Tax=Paraburkholderia humisilvae TaxID=627669 RepID=A0A6J5E828_9BURK|nr:acyl-CoA dehydrogenase family protein [Paraburkholderia humisilvae]CAB3761496.1 Flavin-dependent monooxygenase, oxygenase subunit HsaA [Paraburkholderia humisilvae]